jgi:hypothetical protein
MADEYAALGLDPLQGYFCARAAAMGRVSADVVASAFFSFSPELVRYGTRWDIASPEAVLSARLRAAGACLARLLNGRVPARAVDLLRTAAASCRPEGRPLFAANAGLPWPQDEPGALWHASTLLREYRGDGHIAVLVSHGLDPLEALALDSAYSGKPGASFAWRQWPESETAAAMNRLRDRGFLDAEGALTGGGAKFREMIENETDRLAVPPFAAVGAAACEEALGALVPLAAKIIEGRAVPRFIGTLFTGVHGP